MTMTLTRHRFTVNDLFCMVETGILREDSRIELIEGELIEMAAIGLRHATCVNKLIRLFYRSFSGDFIVSPQNPLLLDDLSLPQPDLVLLPEKYDDPKTHPLPADVLLLIEVADSSLEYDRQTKGRIYAQAGITPYWIVNLVANRIEVYTQPVAGKYQRMQEYGIEDDIPLEILPGSLAVRDIMPPHT